MSDDYSLIGCGVGLASHPVRYSSYTLLCSFRAISLWLYVIYYIFMGGLMIMVMLLVFLM